MKGYIIEKDFKINGYRCVIMGRDRGYRCGYIEVPVNHELYKKHYTYINNYIDVHGGWTYSEHTIGDYPVEANADSWWIGFDCIHCGDKEDIELIKSFGDNPITKHLILINTMFPVNGIVRTVEYVENELIKAVNQIRMSVL